MDIKSIISPCANSAKKNLKASIDSSRATYGVEEALNKDYDYGYETRDALIDILPDICTLLQSGYDHSEIMDLIA